MRAAGALAAARRRTLDVELRADRSQAVDERLFCIPAEGPEVGEDTGVGQEVQEPFGGEVQCPDEGGDIPVQRQKAAEQSRVGTRDDQQLPYLNTMFA